MPSITRRQLLGGGAALAVGGYGGYRLLEGAPAADFEGWQPDEGTWPLARYDAANTAHNPHASPPRASPERREVTSVRYPGRPLVGGERILVYGSGLVTYAPATDDATYLSADEVLHAGIDPEGGVHAIHEIQGEDYHYDVVTYDGPQETSRTSLGEIHPNSLTVGRTEVYVGTSTRELVAIQRGEEDWRASGTMSALAGGRLFATGASGGVAAYGERGMLDGALTSGPMRLWTGAPVHGQSNPPALANGRLVVGDYGLRSGRVYAYDAETGERLWEPRDLGQYVATPAIVDDRGYAAIADDGLDSGRVVALDLETGDTRWEDETDWYAHSPVVGGNTLVVLGDVRRRDVEGDGIVRAYDTASADVLWTVTFDRIGPPFDGIALVGDRVLVTVGTTLYELG